MWQSQPVRLRVTFESAILCDISQGLSYTWRFMNSAGSPVPLPPAVATHRQTITVPNYFLEPGNYTALAKVGWLAYHTTYFRPIFEQELSSCNSKPILPKKSGVVTNRYG